MSVQPEANGRRSVQVEFEVAGTPEEVWQAIATGPGISSWFVPTEFVYGDRAAETLTRVTPVWQAWFQERFPMPAVPSMSE